MHASKKKSFNVVMIQISRFDFTNSLQILGSKSNDTESQNMEPELCRDLQAEICVKCAF